ncbi:MAG TPA: HD domain-containing phosphohydrolase [Gaiellaceae bacterium]|nr:HD domain-containing phosphohydrolase [Gaiellaceae bacterium]
MQRGAPEEQPLHSPRDPNVLISLVACTATAIMAATAVSTWHAVSARPWTFLTFCALTVALQLVQVEVYGRGATSFASAGLLAVGFVFTVGAVMIVAAVLGLVVLIARRGRLNRGVFDAAQFSLAAGAGTAIYHLIGADDWPSAARIAPALAAGAFYMVVNVALLSLAMSLAEGGKPLEIWRERFRWLTPYYLTAGPLALALNVSYDKVGITGLLAFTLPPAAMMLSVRQYTNRTRKSVEEVRAKNEELRQINVQLSERNEDLQALFQFAGGLAARAHDRTSLTGYAQDALARLTGGNVSITLGDGEGGIGLVAGGSQIGAVHLGQTPGFEGERWSRLRDAILPQLATAIESAGLVETVRKRHLETIAALARSMEAKDYYTGGHTERVSEVAVALADRLGYTGVERDAVEIGALLHDIGKIGIPERILHKPGPLDDEEWKVMKEHPVISEYILSEVDLHPIVLKVARSSHERMDGKGYPDGLVGEAIPLPARIVLVADAFDALTSDRPYRSARTVSAAMEELRAHAGTQFCPQVIAALDALYREQPQVLGAATLRAIGEAAA